MKLRERIEMLEQEIYIASSEGDYDTINMLEQQLESLKSKADHPFDDDPYAPEGQYFMDDWYGS
ncbi:hypothetical protein ACPV5L_02480 [Vibrio astriarenae]|uniref:Uncharacterized protein n=1 Tax=Vibrio agarivorans TaxID=153622 RepID=A0ABT7Y6A6_9VIBR|nr:hypothetical protein [Vibrio agarivorans]MDN2483576.1 hypothetical protein [Vibrio agarivorans]MDN3660536.1 hypothetical protein [Vibrio agarivorans]